ncbi:hypothetical protein AAG906_012846 [Vitis piasezkii]
MTVLIPRNLTTLTNHPSNLHLTYLLGVVLSQDYRSLRILELGFGIGLVDIVAASTRRANVTVTGLPYVIPNLQFNAEMNSHI